MLWELARTSSPSKNLLFHWWWPDGDHAGVLAPAALLDHFRAACRDSVSFISNIYIFFSCWSSLAETKAMRLFSLDHSGGFTQPCFSFRKALMIGNNSKLWTWGRSFSCTHNFGSVIRAFFQGCFSACLCFWCALSFTAAHWLTHRKKKGCITSALLIAAQTQTSKSRISKPPTTHVWDRREGQKTVACRCTRAAKLFQGAEVELTCCATVAAVNPSVDLCVLLGEDSWKMFRPLSRRRPQVWTKRLQGNLYQVTKINTWITLTRKMSNLHTRCATGCCQVILGLAEMNVNANPRGRSTNTRDFCSSVLISCPGSNNLPLPTQLSNGVIKKYLSFHLVSSAKLYICARKNYCENPKYDHMNVDKKNHSSAHLPTGETQQRWKFLS